MSKNSSAIRTTCRQWQLRAIACAAASVFASGAANAQTTRPAAPAAATAHFAIAKQPLAKALTTVAQQFGAEIVFDPAAVKGLTASELNGDLTIEQALDRLLAGTKLGFRRTDKGVYLVFAPPRSEKQSEAESELILGLPEIIVRGQRGWSLNTGIARSEDDTQPYIVFDQEQIQRSGAASLEEFFRDHLTADNSATTANQAKAAGQQGLTSVNLRGLGANQTLILIDGRRVSGANNLGDARAGYLGQTQIDGIPLDSIERIEVLASSASGIYGSNAAGGVINIVLRRDYKGFQATLSKGGTFSGGGGTRRFDLAGGTSLEDGRTRLSFFGSVNDADPLLRGQRDFLQRGRQHLLAVDPNFYTKGAGASAPVILGATPNIRSANGSNLVLKNGTALNSPITFLPDGYTSAAGTAPLVANAGKYNLHLAPNALGAGSALLLETRSKSGTIAVRREFTDWLNLYGQVSSSVSETFSPRSRVADTFTLAASAPNNPFTQAIQIAVPAIGADSENQSKTTNQQLVFGATVKLPHDWQAILDASKNWGKYSLKNADGPIDAATALGILKGTIDIFKDLRQSPIAYGYVDPSIGTGNSPSKSTATNLALRLAGPIPVELPGGKPTATFLFEKNRTWLGGITSFTNASTPTAPPAGANVTTLTSVSLASSSSVDFLPQRSRDTKSLYGEIRFPVIGEKNEIPFVRSLEVQVAGRQDKYDEKADMGKTALIPANVINCLSANRFLTAADLDITCPPADTPWLTGSSSRKTFNPTLSLRWQVVEDLALRASYATGFVPPLLSQLQRSPAVNIPAQAYALFGINYFTAKDPLRGNEVIGSKTPIISYTTGGNPDVLPETSKTSSAGLIFTPRFIPDLRLSVDWTHIVQKDNYYSPMTLISGAPTPTQQSQFTAYLQAHPERFTRGPAADGFSVGPITAIDASIGNVLGSKVDAIDLAGSYQMVFQGLGTLDVSARATYLKRLDVQIGPGSAPVQYAGVATSGFSTGADSGGVRWKGNLGASWSTRNWSLGARVRFFGSYYLDADRSYVVPGQGSSTVPKQIYVDLYGTYKLPYDAELRMTANNAFNRAPPFDASPNGAYYSRFGDPRMGFYTVSLSKKF